MKNNQNKGTLNPSSGGGVRRLFSNDDWRIKAAWEIGELLGRSVEKNIEDVDTGYFSVLALKI